MRLLWAAISLAIGYGLWRVSPAVLETLRLQQTAELGQVGVVVIGLTVVERVAARFLH